MKYILLSCLAFTSLTAFGQYYYKRDTPDSSVKSFQSRQITIDLKPVVIENGRYFFDGRRITYDGMMPLMISLDDEKIDHSMKTVNTLVDLKRPIYYLEFAAITIGGFRVISTGSGQDSYLYSAIALFVFNRLYDLSIAFAKKRTIKRYNEVVFQPSAPISANVGFSLGCTIRF